MKDPIVNLGDLLDYIQHQVDLGIVNRDTKLTELKLTLKLPKDLWEFGPSTSPTFDLKLGEVYESQEGDLYDVVEHTPGHGGGADFTCVNRRDETRYGFGSDGKYDSFNSHPRNFVKRVEDSEEA